MYGKFFASTFTGSMLGAGSVVFAVWGYVIANCQKGSVELNPKLLAMILGAEEKDILAAIDYLSAPDPASRCKENEGRRMVQSGPYFYEVPNHSTYRKMLNDDERREYFRHKKREQRERQKDKALTRRQRGLSKTVKDMSTVSTDVNTSRGRDQNAEAEPENAESEIASGVVHQRFIDDWMKYYEAKYKAKYAFQGGRDGKAVKTLLGFFQTPADAKAFIKSCHARDGDGYPFTNTSTLSDLANNISKLQAALIQPPRANGPNGHSKPKGPNI